MSMLENQDLSGLALMILQGFLKIICFLIKPHYVEIWILSFIINRKKS